MSVAQWLQLLTLSAMWGASFFFIAIALRELTPFTMALYRVAPAGLFLLVYLYARGGRLPSDIHNWRILAYVGAVGIAMPFTLITWGQQYIDSGLASILNATTPIFTVVMAHVFTSDERLSANRVLGVALGMAGIVALVGPEAFRGVTKQAWGELAVLGAAFCYATAGIVGRNVRGISSLSATSGTLLIASLTLVPMALLFEHPLPPVRPATWGALAWLSIMGTALAYLLYYRLLRTVGATNTLLVTFLIPVNALLLGILLLGETLDRHAVIGMALVFCGLLAVDGRLLLALRSGRDAPSAGA